MSAITEQKTEWCLPPGTSDAVRAGREGVGAWSAVSFNAAADWIPGAMTEHFGFPVTVEFDVDYGRHPHDGSAGGMMYVTRA